MTSCVRSQAGSEFDSSEVIPAATSTQLATPSPTTPPHDSPLAGLNPPDIIYILGNQVISLTAGSDPQTLGTLPGNGEIKAMLISEDWLFILRADSLQRVDLVTGSIQVLERFPQPVL